LRPLRGTSLATFCPWAIALILVLWGVASRNPAALLFGQVIWVGMLLPARHAWWTRFPAGTLLLVAGYLLVAEGLWLISAVRDVSMSAWAPLVVHGVSAGLGGVTFVHLRRRFRHGGSDEPGPCDRQRTSPLDLLLVGCVTAITVPILRPGRLLGAVQLSVPGWEHMHNLARASLVDERGFIDYGGLSPARHASGDYYPRGFHLVFSVLGRASRLSPNGDLQAWMLGYVRMYWLVWAMIAVTAAACAFHATFRVTARSGLSMVSALASMAIVFVPQVMYRVITPGFSSFALGTLAVAVSLSAFLFERPTSESTVIAAAGFAVASHGWLLLAPVALVGTLCLLVVSALGRGTSGSRRSEGSTWRVAVPLAPILSLAARPWWFTLSSGDAGAQAQENGAIESPPALIVVGCIAACLTYLAVAPRWGIVARSSVPALLLGALFVVSVRAAAWHVDYYYPKKVLWGALLLLAPLAVSGVIAAGCAIIGRLPDALRKAAEVGGGVTLLAVVALTVHSTLAQVVLNRPFLGKETVQAAERAVDFRPSAQLIVWQVGTSGDSRLASMWGRAARDVREQPSIDVSSIDFSAISVADICEMARDSGVEVELLVGSGRASPVSCP
jgi:hypothetical protein